MTSVFFHRGFERGFGTYPLKGEDCHAAIAAAIETGYRAFDTAQMYQNEADVGAALATCGAPYDQLLITTKVHPDNYSVNKFLPSVRASLAALKVDQVDVLLLHWPPADGDVTGPLRLLSEARAEGLSKHIGVSNFNAAMMRRVHEIIDDPIVTNQVEFHPLLNQDVLLSAATETNIPLSSYCSVARGEIFKHALFAEIGDSYGKSAAQVALRWILQKGVSINTMSTKPHNIKANFDLIDFTLSSVDMGRIDALTRTNYRIVTADVSPWAPPFD